jgi:uncharacterized membrane protein YfhO
VKVSARRPAWLVVTDTFEPSWRASVDGAPAPILRANAMFRAVRVSAGEHEVVFRYLPTSFVVGSILSLLAIASGIGLILAAPRRATP